MADFSRLTLTRNKKKKKPVFVGINKTLMRLRFDRYLFILYILIMNTEQASKNIFTYMNKTYSFVLTNSTNSSIRSIEKVIIKGSTLLLRLMYLYSLFKFDFSINSAVIIRDLVPKY